MSGEELLKLSTMGMSLFPIPLILFVGVTLLAFSSEVHKVRGVGEREREEEEDDNDHNDDDDDL